MTIDWWTLALQVVNFLVLIWILTHFFFRPVSAMVARRQAEAGKVLADAEAAREAADKAKADAVAARAAIESERDHLIEQARAEAAKERARLLAEATETAKARSADAAAALERERAAMEAGLVTRVRGLAIEIARRLLTRLPPGAMLEAFLASLCDEVPKLDKETRATFTGAAALRRSGEPRPGRAGEGLRSPPDAVVPGRSGGHRRDRAQRTARLHPLELARGPRAHRKGIEP